jgi:hypothetical protein
MDTIDALPAAIGRRGLSDAEWTRLAPLLRGWAATGRRPRTAGPPSKRFCGWRGPERPGANCPSGRARIESSPPGSTVGCAAKHLDGLVANLYLFRTAAQDDFGAKNVACYLRLAPHICQAVQLEIHATEA